MCVQHRLDALQRGELDLGDMMICMIPYYGETCVKASEKGLIDLCENGFANVLVPHAETANRLHRYENERRIFQSERETWLQQRRPHRTDGQVFRQMRMRSLDHAKKPKELLGRSGIGQNELFVESREVSKDSLRSQFRNALQKHEKRFPKHGRLL